jgi:hypothetical protein
MKQGNTTPYQILKITRITKGVSNIDNDLIEWQKNRDQMAKWIKLNCLLSLYSYFELYLNRVTRTAQESDPGLFLGASKTIDGVKILKANDWKDAYLPNYSADVTKGTWSQRIAALESTFFIDLPFAKTKIALLEKSRKVRNSIAHYFGRDLDGDSILNYTDTSDISLSENILINYLGVFEKLVCEIDSKMIGYIGEYELIKYYHDILKKQRIEKVALKKMINSSDLWETKSIDYCEKLINYYRTI